MPIGKDSLEYRLVIRNYVLIMVFSCECRKGFTGRFCEVSLGACAQNDHICKNGTCKNDVHFKRGFYCECNDNFFGINCEIDTETNFFDRYNVSLIFNRILFVFLGTLRLDISANSIHLSSTYSSRYSSRSRVF